MVETEIRIEADREDGREEILRQQGVAERQQGIDRVARRAAVAGLEVEGAPRRRAAEHPAKRAEIGACRLSFEPEEDAGIGCLIEAGQHAGHLDGGRLIAAPDDSSSSWLFARRERISSVRWLAIFACTTAFASARALCRVGKGAVLVDPQHHVLRRRRRQRADEAAIAGQQHHRHLVLDQGFEGLRRDLHVAEEHHLPHRGQWHAIDLLAVLADDQVLAALADVRARLLQIEHGPFIEFRDHARDVCRPRLLLDCCWSSSVEKPGLLGLTDREQRAAIATMRQSGGSGGGG